MPQPLRLGLVLGGLLALAAPPAVLAGAPILAVEDSLPVYTLPETTRVVAKRLPIAELIRKAQEGERRKYDGVETLAYDRVVKVTLRYTGRNPKTRCIENVTRVYYRRPDQWAEVPLRESKYGLDADGRQVPWDPDEHEGGSDSGDEGIGGGMQIEVGEGDEAGRSLEHLPPYLEEVDKFEFRIAHRSLQRDQVLYEIEFEPKSDFDVLPGGRVWLVTNGYRIVREEYRLKNLPVPWLLKSVGLLTFEWQEVQGRWVPQRVAARAELRKGVFLGLTDVPSLVEVVVLFDAYRIDPALDPEIFEKARP